MAFEITISSGNNITFTFKTLGKQVLHCSRFVIRNLYLHNKNIQIRETTKNMLGEQKVVLHSFWASSCTWRVRAALRYKGIKHEEVHYEIIKTKDHLTDEFYAINPAQKVPALEIDGETLIESMAILEYLEETRPEPSLLPSTPLLRSRMREICEVVVSGIQPMQNVGHQWQTKEQFEEVALYYTDRGLKTLEELIVKTSGGKYCIGDQLSMADLCLVPQVYNAVIRRKLDITKYPTISKLYNSLLQEDVFKATHPNHFRPK